MSLADLPDVLIAHLCSYLDYSDVCNLMETSKKNYNAIKAYKKDKLELEPIWLSQCHFNYNNQFRGKNGRKRHVFNKSDDSDVIHVSLKKILDECSSLNYVKIDRMDLTSAIFNVLIETKAKIDYVLFDDGNVDLSPGEFAKLCKKYKGSRFINSVFTEGVWNDEVLAPIVFDTKVELSDETSFSYKSAVMPITDLTLMALVGKEKHQNRFKIPGIHNSMTIKGIVSVLQKFQDRIPEDLTWTLHDEPYVRERRRRPFYESDYEWDDDIETLGDFAEERYQETLENSYWNLGILQKDQLEDANRYFNKETGELKHLYKITINNNSHYKIILPKNLVKYFDWAGIHFTVHKK